MAENPYVKRRDEYLKFVGEYVNQFTSVEYDIVRYCRDYSGLSRPAFRIFMAKQTQLGARIGILKKLVALAHLDDDARLAVRDAFGQLDHLIALRHRVVHHGGHPVDPDKVLIRLKETDLSKDTQHPYDLYDQQELWDALIDLHLVQRILFYRLERSLDDQAKIDLGVNGVRTAPWQYTGRELVPHQK